MSSRLSLPSEMTYVLKLPLRFLEEEEDGKINYLFCFYCYYSFLCLVLVLPNAVLWISVTSLISYCCFFSNSFSYYFYSYYFPSSSLITSKTSSSSSSLENPSNKIAKNKFSKHKFPIKIQLTKYRIVKNLLTELFNVANKISYQFSRVNIWKTVIKL